MKSPLTPKDLWFAAYQLDIRSMEETRQAGCPHCQGELQVANYTRSPRGITSEIALEPELLLRHSLCCADCRRRTLPRSVRFFGRLVYGLSFFTELSAFLTSGDPRSLASLSRLTEVSRQTLRRWRRAWLRIQEETNLLRCWRGTGFRLPVNFQMVHDLVVLWGDDTEAWKSRLKKVENWLSQWWQDHRSHADPVFCWK